jgi:hypothetical protein
MPACLPALPCNPPALLGTAGFTALLHCSRHTSDYTTLLTSLQTCETWDNSGGGGNGAGGPVERGGNEGWQGCGNAIVAVWTVSISNIYILYIHASRIARYAAWQYEQSTKILGYGAELAWKLYGFMGRTGGLVISIAKARKSGDLDSHIVETARDYTTLQS